MRRVARQRRRQGQRRGFVTRVQAALVYGLAYAFVSLIGLTAIVIAYWLKSAAGINVFEGHSPLHGLFH